MTTRTTNTPGEPPASPDGVSALPNQRRDGLGLGLIARGTGDDDLTLIPYLALAVHPPIVADRIPIPVLALTLPDHEGRTFVLKVARCHGLRIGLGVKTRKINAGDPDHAHCQIRILTHSLNAVVIRGRSIELRKRKNVEGERKRRKRRKNTQLGARAHAGENMASFQRQTFITKRRNSEPGSLRSENSIRKLSPRIKSAKNFKYLSRIITQRRFLTKNIITSKLMSVA